MPDISAKKTPPFTLGLWAEETTRGSPYELAALGPYRGPTKVVVGEILISREEPQIYSLG